MTIALRRAGAAPDGANQQAVVGAETLLEPGYAGDGFVQVWVARPRR